MPKIAPSRNKINAILKSAANHVKSLKKSHPKTPNSKLVAMAFRKANSKLKELYNKPRSPGNVKLSPKSPKGCFGGRSKKCVRPIY